jgi:hypothetical protein
MAFHSNRNGFGIDLQSPNPRLISLSEHSYLVRTRRQPSIECKLPVLECTNNPVPNGITRRENPEREASEYQANRSLLFVTLGVSFQDGD